MPKKPRSPLPDTPGTIGPVHRAAHITSTVMPSLAHTRTRVTWLTDERPAEIAKRLAEEEALRIALERQREEDRRRREFEERQRRTREESDLKALARAKAGKRADTKYPDRLAPFYEKYTSVSALNLYRSEEPSAEDVELFGPMEAGWEVSELMEREVCTNKHIGLIMVEHDVRFGGPSSTSKFHVLLPEEWKNGPPSSNEHAEVIDYTIHDSNVRVMPYEFVRAFSEHLPPDLREAFGTLLAVSRPSNLRRVTDDPLYPYYVSLPLALSVAEGLISARDWKSTELDGASRPITAFGIRENHGTFEARLDGVRWA